MDRSKGRIYKLIFGFISEAGADGKSLYRGLLSLMHPQLIKDDAQNRAQEASEFWLTLHFATFSKNRGAGACAGPAV